MNVFNDDHDHDDNPFVNFQGESGQSDMYFLLSMSFISSSLVLLLIISLYLYAKCALTRHARSRAAIRQLTPLTILPHHSIEPPNTGLDPTIIAALPVFVFKQKKNEHEHSPDDDGASVMECAVCLSALEDEEMVKLLPNCKHAFHVGCIDTWLASHSTCPMCRTMVRPRLEPQPRERPTSLVQDGAPLLEHIEGTSYGGGVGDPSHKIISSNSRLSSFRGTLSRDSSSRRIQPSSHDDVDLDLERQ